MAKDGRTPDERWADNTIQFARLLCEINANVGISTVEWGELCESMDLPSERVAELFDRAHEVWEAAKEAARG